MKQKKSGLKIKYNGKTGDGLTILLSARHGSSYLKVKFDDSTGEFHPCDTDSINLEVLDLTRKDLKRLQQAGFKLVLKKVI